MRKFIRDAIIFAISLYLSNELWQNMLFHNGLQTITTLALFLVLFDRLLKPLIKLLLLPINLLTLGVVGSIVELFPLYLASLFSTSFSVAPINLEHLLFTQKPFSTNLFLTYLLISVTLRTYFIVFRKFIK